jgi:hypothetical protein
VIWLNWRTLAPSLACCDDGVWRAILPRALVARAERARAAATDSRPLGAFTRLPLVNTHAPSARVGRVRDQLVIEGPTMRS